MGLVEIVGSGMGVADVEAAALAALFETCCNAYVGKVVVVLSTAKSLVTILSKLDRMGLSTVSSQSR